MGLLLQPPDQPPRPCPQSQGIHRAALGALVGGRAGYPEGGSGQVGLIRYPLAVFLQNAKRGQIELGLAHVCHLKRHT